jgi:glutamate-1-semialdehyde 2,1-aminomutase
MSFYRSQSHFETAQKYIPGGVNSPVRAFKSVGGTPPFIRRAEGAYLWDEDGNRYIDYVGSWGPMILGHAHPAVLETVRETMVNGLSFGAPTTLETELAKEIIRRVPAAEMVRLVNSGTEATMSAIRLARGITGRDKIIKFTGSYHGHADAFLIAAGSGALTIGVPNSPGVTKASAADTLLAQFNSIESVKALFENNPSQIAALIVEPVNGNTGTIPPDDGFLEKLRALCTEYGALLIFDEVMTGFRIARGGANEKYGVQPDLLTFGKVIGGGMPIGAYAGKRELMEHIAPAGPVYQAGTLSGNPVAVSAGLSTLKLLENNVYQKLEEAGAFLENEIQQRIAHYQWPLSQNRVGSMFTLFFTPGPVRCTEDLTKADFPRFNKFFHALLENGIYMAPSQYEAAFLSIAHNKEDISRTIEIMEKILQKLF